MATFIVDTTADELFGGGDLAAETADGGGLSLREAVELANANAGADVIRFAEGLSGQTLTLLAGQLELLQAVTIDGDTNGDNRADVTISGGDVTRIFQIDNERSTLQSLTLTNGAGDFGGAIQIGYGGGLSLDDSTIRDSAASVGSGGAIRGFYSGGGIYISNSLIVGNSAGIYGGGLYSNGTNITISNTTIADNTANGTGGGISLTGGGTITITNSTISGNRADADGIGTGGGGGIETFNTTSVTVANTVFSDNLSGTGSDENDVQGTITTAINSAFDDASVTITNSTNNIFNLDDAGLGALQNNGGTVDTRNILAGSQLIDAGSDTAAQNAVLGTDANGADRFAGSAVDIGATELQLVVTTANDDAFDGGDLADELADGGGLSLREAVALANAGIDADTITFAQSLAGQTLVLSGGNLFLTQDVTIDGDINGDRKADVILSGGGNSRIFTVSGPGTDVEFLSLTLTGGNATSGGAIRAETGTSLDLVDSTISGNSGGTRGGGIYAYGSTVRIGNSTISDNTTSGNSYGGGIYTRAGSLTLVNTTITGNSAQYGAGISNAYLGSAIESDIRIYGSTVIGNTGGYGLGLYGRLNSIFNSVIGAVDGVAEVAGTTFFTSVLTITNDTGGNIVGGDPGLAPLADNGGPVRTMSLLPGSPLRDSGSAANLPLDFLDLDRNGILLETLTVDARGQPRVVGGQVDLGALESPIPILGNNQGQTLDGTAVHDILIGLGGNDTLRGFAAADIMVGGLGDDTYFIDDAGDIVIEAAGQGTADRVVTSVSYTLAPDAEIERMQTLSAAGTDAINLTGNAFKQTLIGNSGDNRLDGKGGGDAMNGGAGNDTYVVNSAADTISDAAGRGIDKVVARVSFNLNAGAEIETLQTISAAGTAAINLGGNEFAQKLIGNAGNNRLDGKGGADNMSGGAGDDTYVVDQAGDRVIEAAGKGNDRLVASVSYALSSTAEIETMQTASAAGTDAINLTGNSFAQTLIGNAGDNRLDGRGGTDVMNGGAGNDTYVVDRATDVVNEAAGKGTADRVIASTSYSLSATAEIEQMQTISAASTTALNLTGNSFEQTLIGNAGNNRLDGKGGADIMSGGFGNDTYVVDNSADTVIDAAGRGIDKVIASASFALSASAEIEAMQTDGAAGTKAINLTGNQFDQSISGNNGDNRIDGKGGADTLRGFGGNDTFVFSTGLGATIADFNVTADQIELSSKLFSGLTAGALLPASQFAANTSGAPTNANHRIIYETDTGNLFFDGDGSGGAFLAVKFATLSPNLALTADDFFVA